MKFRVLVMLALISLFVLISLPAAMATSIPAKGDTMVLDSYNPSDMAGIMTFKVYPGGGTTYYYFSTFCIQDNVFITPGATDIVAAVSTNLGDPSGPSLNWHVDYLFSQWASGAFGSFGQTNQADFQDLLWSWQGETIFYTNGVASSSYTPIAGLPWNALNYWSGITASGYGTQVLNLTSADGVDVQNMLVYNPGGGGNPPAVPEPSSLLLLGSGLTALGWAIRRRK